MRVFARVAAALAILAMVKWPCAVAWGAGPPAVTTHEIKGTVRDALGRPVANAAVMLEARSGKTVGKTVSAHDGSFRFANIAPAMYAVIANKPGFKTATAIVMVTAAGAKPVELAMSAEAALSMPVVAKRRAPSRATMPKSSGASDYSFSSEAIHELPQGANTSLNQVLLQAPGVVQDSLGQLHVRGDHADLQYRINGVQLPDGLTGFGETISPRFAKSLSLLTGALPAQYGYRTAGIVDIQTKTGAALDGGDVEFYGGQRDTTQPSFEYGGSSDNFDYFVTGQYMGNDRGVEPPTPGPTAIHDRTDQGQGFGYFSYLLNPTTKISLIAGTAVNEFQIPANPGQTPVYTLAGVPSYPSADIAESQFEQNYFGVLALNGVIGRNIDYQFSGFSRYSTISFNPDYAGDLIYNGISSRVFRSDIANGLQFDGTWHGLTHHSISFGAYFSGERAEIDNHAAVFPIVGGFPLDVPVSITDDKALTSWLYGIYVQDEWHPFEKVTIDYGARFDLYDGLVRADQFSPRFALIYTPRAGTALHASYARYFTPPPTEQISVTDIAKFGGTTGAPPTRGNSTPAPERDNYFDAGITQDIAPGLQAGVDGYYKMARDLLDEGQFGAAYVYTPFNYEKGRVYGVEFTGSYSAKDLYLYSNFAYGVAQGTHVVSGQFNFTQAELDYIRTHYIALDHDQTFTASVGGMYRWREYMFSVDSLYGSGLRRGFANTGNMPPYLQVNAAIARKFSIPGVGTGEARIAMINVFDHIYQIRNGTGIGVFAAQYGPRRTLYGGIKWDLPAIGKHSTTKIN